ncbi:MAG: exodeoxyribonuclease V subunit gamma [Myxococcota bacterium]
MLTVERSNRTERLFEGLSARLMAPGRNPLAPSTVVVQGPGMERWLAQSLARRHGVCANTEFIFPRAFLERVFAQIEGEAKPAPGIWEGGRLVWAVAGQLEALRDDPDFGSLALHLDAPDGAWRRLQLAGEIAAMLDRYATHRPQWLHDWCAGRALPTEGDARWQGRLVQALGTAYPDRPFADRALRVLEALESAPSQAALAKAWPRGIEVFAVSTLLPVDLAVLDRVSQIVDVHLSILSPSRQWWAELWHEVREAERAGLLQPGGLPMAPLQAEALIDPPTPTGRLLAGLGRLGADFQRCLEELESAQEAEEDRYETPDSDTLLGRLQRRFLDLDLPADDERRVAAADDSIQFHRCHGPRRELEVVHAQLHEAFRTLPDLVPEEVIVMAPGIDAIAPDIEAVFGALRAEDGAIPHRIADRGAMRRSPVAEAFVALLQLITGRAGRGEVIDWLAREPVRARFGLEPDDVEAVTGWAVRAGIRFGLDAAHREALGLASDPAHTWTEGLARLALSHAVGTTGAAYGGLAPERVDAMADPGLLGALGDLVDLLIDARRVASGPRSVAGWCRWLGELLDRSSESGDRGAEEHVRVRTHLQRIAEDAAVSGFEDAIPFEAIRERVVEALTASPAPQAFLAGGVTFCELVPLRAIPFRVVVILGLTDGAFPRGRPAPGYDLMARAPRAGDRNQRTDDRYLFLEALLSARDRLILTAPARDVRDGSDLPLSIVVTEPLEALEQTFEIEEGGDLAEQLVVSHALHGFSPTYFEGKEGPGLRAVDPDAYAGARARREALAAGGGPTRRFLDAPIDEADAPEPVAALPLEGLISRITRASRSFLRDRLHVRLPREEDVVDELDPFTLDGLERWRLGSALLEAMEEGVAPEAALEGLVALPSTPRGVAGISTVRSIHAQVLELVRLVEHRRSVGSLPDFEGRLDVPLASGAVVRLSGWLDRLTPEGRVLAQFSKLGRRSELEEWIRHVFLCALVEEGTDLAPRTFLVGRPAEGDKDARQVIEFGPVEGARDELARLLAWALASGDGPLPFFPETSRAYAQGAQHDRDQARRSANLEFLGSSAKGSGSRPESERELETIRLWEGRAPLSEAVPGVEGVDFAELALAIYSPLLAARKGHAS